MSTKEVSVTSRFWANVDIQTIDGCWTWDGCRVRGYGTISIYGKRHFAHRVAYEMLRNPIPAGLYIDHLCRNRACVNPDHLEPVTNRENILRGTSIHAQNARKTHCPRGHEYTTENTMRAHGARYCRICHREQGRQSYARHRNEILARRRAAIVHGG